MILFVMGLLLGVGLTVYVSIDNPAFFKKGQRLFTQFDKSDKE